MNFDNTYIKEFEYLKRKIRKLTRNLENAEKQRERSNIFLQQLIEESEKHKLKLIKNNEVLEASIAKRKKLDEEKNEFLGIAAHDLKNPLSIIKEGSNLILNGNLTDSEIKEFAGDIHNTSKVMFDIIINLLDVNRIEQGKIEVFPEMVDLNFIVNSAINKYKSVSEKKDISLIFSSDLTKYIEIDINIFIQIFDNLLSNAIKFSPKGKSVYISVFENEKTVEISIKDEGPGLTEDDQKKLFKKFSRLSAQPTGGENSTGLGLSIGKKLVEICNGKISCESIYGEGAEFKVEFPKNMK